MRCPNDAKVIHFIPDGCVICPVCAEEKSRVAMREFQRRPLGIVAQGKGVLKTRLILGTWHVQLFGGERTQCNRPLESHHRRSTATYENYIKANDRVCRDCQSEIQAIVNEEVPCSA